MTLSRLNYDISLSVPVHWSANRRSHCPTSPYLGPVDGASLICSRTSPYSLSHSSSSDPLTSTHYWYQKTNITAPLPCLKHVGHQRDPLDLLSQPPPASPMLSTASNPAEPTHCTPLCNTVLSSWNTLLPPFTSADLIFKSDLYSRHPQSELPSFPVATHPPEMIIRAPPPRRP